MPILIVASTKDVASLNIRHQLLTAYDFKESAEKFHHTSTYHTTMYNHEVKLVTIDREPIYYSAITDYFNPELIIYLSRHRSKSGIPTLTVHTPGNLGKAENGGLPNELSVAPANAMKEALLEMAQQKRTMGLKYQVSYECTHHGPSLHVPTMFVELGSSPTQWKDVKAARAVAHAAIAASFRSSKPSTVAVGIGGPHYSEKFTRIALQSSYAFGHIIPKYALSQINEAIIRQCVERTLENIAVFLVDWKGIRGADKHRLMEILETFDVEIKKI
jgi:D-tyrosyl-tRNA(Tyr) deacylase